MKAKMSVMLLMLFVMVGVASLPSLAAKSKPKAQPKVSRFDSVLEQFMSEMEELGLIEKGFNQKMNLWGPEVDVGKAFENYEAECKPHIKKMVSLEGELVRLWLEKPTSGDLNIILSLADFVSAVVLKHTPWGEASQLPLAIQILERAVKWTDTYPACESLGEFPTDGADMEFILFNVIANEKYFDNLGKHTEIMSNGFISATKAIKSFNATRDADAQKLSSAEFAKKYKFSTTSATYAPIRQSTRAAATNALSCLGQAFDFWDNNRDPLTACLFLEVNYNVAYWLSEYSDWALGETEGRASILQADVTECMDTQKDLLGSFKKFFETLGNDIAPENLSPNPGERIL